MSIRIPAKYRFVAAAATALSAFILSAMLPYGSAWLHTHPISVYPGKPVGYAIPRINGTTWKSP